MAHGHRAPSPSEKLLVALSLIADSFLDAARAASGTYEEAQLDTLKKAIRALHTRHPQGIYATYPPDWDDIKPKPVGTAPCPTCGKP